MANDNQTNRWIVSQVMITEKGTTKNILDTENLDYHLPSHNPMEHARHYGTEVFEGIRAFFDKQRDRLHIINFDQHIDRLFRSMSKLYMIDNGVNEIILPLEVIEHLKPYDKANDLYFTETKQFVKDLIVENLLINIEAGLITPENDHIYIRPLVTRGGHKDNKLGVHSTNHYISLEIMVQEWAAYLNNPTLAVYNQQISNPLRQHKCGANYGFGGIAKNWATVDLATKYDKKFDDALIVNPQNNIDEATGANFFAFDEENRLWTPPTSQYILPGTKRETAIEMAKQLGIKVVQESIPIYSVFPSIKQGGTDADTTFKSGFLTGTATGFEGIFLLYNPTNFKYTQFRPTEEFIEMKTQYNRMVRGEEVYPNLKNLQQKTVLNHAVDFSSILKYR